jgi:PAS domain S-box-containing protein
MLVYDAGTLGILAANEAAVLKYGYSREEFLGLTIAKLKLPEDAAEFLRKQGEPPGGLEHVGVWRHRKRDGSLLYADITRAAIPFDGKVAVLLLAVDVTEQKQLEQQLRHSQKMEAVGQLAGGVAHDFNNLLSVIVMYASLLREQEPLSQKQTDHLDQILASAERAANLTRSLLIFSRKQSFDLTLLDLNEAVRRLASLLQRVLGEEIRLHVRTAALPLVVLADGGQVEQVIMNLCTNARDAMPRGGTLTLAAGAVEMDEAFLHTHGFGRAGSYALLSVADTGSGMDEGTQARIFEPFFTTKDIGKGTGLGLAIVYGIVKQHEGFIGVTSRQGEGTVFDIFLPLRERALTIEGGAAAPRPRGGRETILLAEDEEAVRRITRMVLEESGYSVVEALDGADAVRQFQAFKGEVRLFLTDVIMPKKNGREAYEEMLRSDPALKVLFTSGYTADFLEQRGIESGAINFLPKPASPSDLLRKVREVLDA